jgi:GNAT superfamily N-acetyltransferase
LTGIRIPDGFTIETLCKKHHRAGFRSGQEPVDRHLAERALQAQDKRLSTTRVLIHESSSAVAGYYTLAIGQVSFAELPPDLVKKLPRRDLPVAILAWLGVDATFQRRGLGERLLALALRDCWSASRTFPIIAVVLDCLDEATRGFYRRWNFRELPRHPLRLYLSAAELEAMMRTR